MRRLAVLFGALLLTAAASPPIRTLNPMTTLSYLVGDWTCTVHSGGKSETYHARFSYTAGNTWMQETDTWTNGGDQLVFTYIPGKRVWRAVVSEYNGNVTVFEAPDTGLSHVAYRSVYPDATMQDTFDRVSTTRFTMHFRQQTAHGINTGNDNCVKAK